MNRIGAQSPAAGAACPTRIPAIDQALPGGGLALGMTHEWFLDAQFPQAPFQGWLPPSTLMAWLAGCHRPSSGGALTIWIGRRTWPTPWTLAKSGLPLHRCLFIDPRDESERLWAIDLCLRCQAAAAIVADASGLDMPASRRLQLAAESGGTLGLLVRPPHELKELSAAATRWVVSPQPGQGVQWKVELRRCKAGALWSKASNNAVREWTLAWQEGWKKGCVEVAREASETDRLHLAPDVAGGPGPPQARRTA